MLLQGTENYRSWEKKHKTQCGGREKKKTIKIPKVKTPQQTTEAGLFSSWIFLFPKSRTSERPSQKQSYSPVIVCRNGPSLIHLTWISARSKYIWKIKKILLEVFYNQKKLQFFKLILGPKLFYWFQLTTVLYRQENWSRKDLKAVFSSAHE